MQIKGAVIGGVVMLVVVAGITGASAAVAPAPLAVARYSTVEESVPMTPASTYLVTMRGLLIGQPQSNQTDSELIYSAQQLCANEVAAGLTWKALDQKVNSLGMSRPFYRAYVQAAVTAYCPDRLPGLSG